MQIEIPAREDPSKDDRILISYTIERDKSLQNREKTRVTLINRYVYGYGLLESTIYGTYPSRKPFVIKYGGMAYRGRG